MTDRLKKEDFIRLLATQMNADEAEELNAKGNQSVGDVPTQNIYGFSPRIAENGNHHKGE